MQPRENSSNSTRPFSQKTLIKLGGWRRWWSPWASTRPWESQVSAVVADLDAQVEAFREPLDVGPYAFLAADALVLKVREGGRVVAVHALVVTGSSPTSPFTA